jgi:NAD(P)H-hydrate epimerase
LNDVLEVKLTEEMTLPSPETERRTLSLAGMESLRTHAQRVNVVAIGSGLSRDPEAAEVVRRLASQVSVPLVIDADGLNAFAGHAEQLMRIPVARILTPHVGEMARLTGEDAAALEARRIDATGHWARSWGSVVVLKGAPTVTASAEGHATVNPTGNPGMATAGMGDVLTGLIAALVGQGLSAYDAARLGAYVHGMAGDRVARSRGQQGLIASDVIDTLPETLKALIAIGDEVLEKKGR